MSVTAALLMLTSTVLPPARLTSKAYDYRAEAYTKLGKPELAAKDRAMSVKLKEALEYEIPGFKALKGGH